jgi:hypothetical protein
MTIPSKIPPIIPDSEKLLIAIQDGDKIDRCYMTKQQVKLFLLISGYSVVYGAEHLC